MRVCCLLFQKAQPENLAEACLRFTPKVMKSSEALFLEIGGCQKIYSEDSLQKRLVLMGQRFECAFRIGIANDIPTALAKARFGDVPKRELPIEALLDYACPLDKNLMSEALPMLSLLKNLGVETLGSFLDIPSQSLSARFQRLGLILHQRTQGLLTLPWSSTPFPSRVEESFSLDEHNSVQSAEPLFFLLKKPMERGVSRLRGRAERVTQLELKIELERYSTVKEYEKTIVLDFSTPQGSAPSLLSMLRERIEWEFNQRPLEAPIVQCTLSFRETIPCAGSQKSLFSQEEEQREKLLSLVERLKNKLGREQVFQAAPIASYIPEHSWEKSEAPPKDIHQSPLPQRPLKLLKKPLRVGRIDNYLIYKGSSLKIIEEDGPERLEGYWWHELFHRDYFTMKVQTGETLWLYRSDASGTFFLQGIFD